MMKRAGKDGDRLRTRTFNISWAQMRDLWQIYHTLALHTEILDPHLEVSVMKLKEFLFHIPKSDKANPRQDIPDEHDWGALR